MGAVSAALFFMKKVKIAQAPWSKTEPTRPKSKPAANPRQRLAQREPIFEGRESEQIALNVINYLHFVLDGPGELTYQVQDVRVHIRFQPLSYLHTTWGQGTAIIKYQNQSAEWLEMTSTYSSCRHATLGIALKRSFDQVTNDCPQSRPHEVQVLRRMSIKDWVFDVLLPIEGGMLWNNDWRYVEEMKAKLPLFAPYYFK